MQVVDYFTPSNQAYLQQNDLDLGSCGPFNLDDKYVVTSSKEGTFYALDISSLGKYNPDNNNGNAHQVLTKVFGAFAYSLKKAAANATVANSRQQCVGGQIKACLVPQLHTQQHDWSKMCFCS